MPARSGPFSVAGRGPARGPAAPPHVCGIDSLDSLSSIDAALGTLLAQARREVVGFRDGSPLTAHALARTAVPPPAAFVSADGLPLRVRTTYDPAILEHAGAGDGLRARAAGGEQSRYLTGVPFSAVVIDNSAALIDLTSYDSSGSGSLVARDPRLVAALARLAERLWTLAAPGTCGASEDAVAASPRLGAVLSLLAAGATDGTIAAQTGLSRRTVERSVRALMDELGVTTRFQAGVQAVRRGWI